MARSMSREASASLTAAAGTATLDSRLAGASRLNACASGARNIISPRSESDSRQCRSLDSGSKSASPHRLPSSASSQAITAGAVRSATGVGRRPAGVRTNSASSKAPRSRASALLVAGCDSASCRPASVTEPLR